MIDDVQALLNSIPTLTGNPRPFALESVPADPVSLFVQWLAEAVEDGVAEAKAMTLSTVDAQGVPDARVLILRDVDARGWAFSSSAASSKGQQLAKTPYAVLSCYWVAACRQVRVRGAVTEATPDEAAADFRGKPLASRAESLLGRQSSELGSFAEIAPSAAEASRLLEADPSLSPDHHRLWRLEPDQVEFWQGSQERQHVRLVYGRTERGWTTGLLWP